VNPFYVNAGFNDLGLETHSRLRVVQAARGAALDRRDVSVGEEPAALRRKQDFETSWVASQRQESVRSAEKLTRATVARRTFGAVSPSRAPEIAASLATVMASQRVDAGPPQCLTRSPSTALEANGFCARGTRSPLAQISAFTRP
jgi:hypothetical protein